MESKNKRPIRSFVRRQGRMTMAQKRALEALWAHYGLDVQTGVLDFDAIFHRHADTVLEIGFGMGDSFVEMAKTHPETNFVGVEVHEPGIGACLNAIAKAQLENVRVMQGDVVEILHHRAADHSLTGVQVFFPDPWPKKRHHKRRLIQLPFLDILARKLQKGGFLHVATDWEPYAADMLGILEEHPRFIKVVAEQDALSKPRGRPLTKFEKRGLRLGHVVTDLLFVTPKN